MSYSFCYGPSGSGKSTFLRRMMIRRALESLAKKGEDRTKYIYIVPEQYSMQTQKDLVQDHPSHVLMNIDVLSFGRLAYRVFEETGEDPRTVLDDIGKSLLLRRVASKCEKDLQILQRGIHRPGMIDEIKSVLSEFMQYGIGEKEIGEMAAYAEEKGQNALRIRLEDIRRLYLAFREEQAAKYVTSEETMDLLAAAIPKAESLKGCVVVFDGFTGFTTVQYRVVMALLRCAGEVFFSFSSSADTGPDIAVSIGGGKGGMTGSEEDLFYLIRKTAADLCRMASSEGIPHGRDIDLTPSFKNGVPGGLTGGDCRPGAEMRADRTGEGLNGAARFRSSRVLAHLERHLFRYPERPFQEQRQGETRQGIRLFAASTPQEEVRQIFSMIRKTIARTGCAYRDFAIVTADLETYGDLFELEAVRSGIPVYIDRTSGVFHNILIEGIRSVLQISAENFSYVSVFRYLRSGLSSLSSGETDLLENYCLAHGVRGRKKWSAPFDASCEEARKKFLLETAPVTGLVPSEGAGPGTDERLPQDTGRRQARTVGERTREVYAFLVACGAQEAMDRLSERFGEEGDVVREKQYSQIYRAVIDLLDQVYDLAGEERISARDYLELLEAGFTQVRLGTLPQRVDRILAGDMERTRLTQIRHLYFAGANEGNIPRSSSRGGILSDMDREFLAGGGAVLAPTPRQQIFSQRLYLYLNMTKPSESLTVSFAKEAQDGQSLQASYLISNLQALFPQARIELPETLPAADQISGRADGIRHLADRIRNFVEGRENPDPEERKELALLYGFFTSPEVSADPEIREAVRRIREAALCRYRPELLPEAAGRIYGNVITGGISRMETAAKCLLWQHLRYGLHLNKREVYELETSDNGTILHGAIQRFDALLRKEGNSWAGFTREDALRLADLAIREEAAVYRDLLLYKSARDESLLSRYERRLLRTVDTLQYQLRKGDFTPAASELGFGTEGAELPAIRFDLGGGRALKLVGRIDRVDALEQDGRRFIRIMDYKSGTYDLDMDEIRRGLRLQLISYMNAIMQAGKIPGFGTESGSGPELVSVPSAMLYYRMDDPVLLRSVRDAMAGEEGREEELAKIREQLRPTGLVLEDKESIDHLDRTFSKKSDVIPVTKTNSGYAAYSHLIDEKEFRDLSEAASAVMCSLARRILDGDVTASPAVIDKNLACGWCPYRDVCGFDLRIPGYAPGAMDPQAGPE